MLQSQVRRVLGRSQVLMMGALGMLALGSGVHAQQTLTEAHEDWLLRCQSSPGKAQICEIDQGLGASLATAKGGEPQRAVRLASISLGRPEPKAPITVVLAAPLGVWLPEGVALRIGKAETPLVVARFEYCQANGCIARAELSDAQFKEIHAAGGVLTLAFETSRPTPRKKLTLTTSGKGFSLAVAAMLAKSAR